MYLGLSLAAALCYTVGGVFMKLSEGLSRPAPAVMVFACFLAGAGLQAVAMRQADLGVAYVFVLGLESVLALLFGVFLFGERASLPKAVGILLILIGMVLLHAEVWTSEPSEPVAPQEPHKPPP